jgi:hypothetical protein
MTDPLLLIEFARSAPLQEAERVLGIADWIVKARREAVSLDPAVGPAAPRTEGKPKTIRACIVAVLRQQMQPMHAQAITTAVQNNFRPCSIQTVRSLLGKLARKNTVFKRVGTGRYGLLEWDDEPVSLPYAATAGSPKYHYWPGAVMVEGQEKSE